MQNIFDQPPENEDVIVASSDSEGLLVENNQEEPALPDLNAPVEVEVFIPMDNGQPLQLIPDEIQIDELMDQDQDEQPMAQQNAPLIHNQDNDMQLGFVNIFQPEGDPVFLERFQFQPDSELFKNNPEAVRIWAHFFAPGPGSSAIKVPQIWADFFTAVLANPSCFLWAKEFLSSPAWKYFQSVADPTDIPFCLPPKAPPMSKSFCASHSQLSATSVDPQNISQPTSEAQSPVTPPELIKQKVAASPGPWSKHLLDLAASGDICDKATSSKARRSLRQKDRLKGFKPSACSSKDCLGCSLDPPTISPSVIKNLGADFCKIDPVLLSNNALSKKNKAAAPGGKKQIKKSSNPDKNEDEDQRQNRKKSKK